MKAPVHKLKKQQLVWLSEHNCEAHKHSYLEHYNCFLREQDAPNERIGFLDIESSGLNADYGMMLTWAILDSKDEEVLHDEISREDIYTAKPGQEDKRITKSLIETLKKFDKVVTYYGARFDIPFIRTRAAVNRLKFLPYGALVHKDLWFTVRGKFKISSNRLENACRVILGKSRKNRILSKYWNGAVRGEEDCIAYIADHNQRDVWDLADLFYKTEEFGRPVAASI